MMREMPAMASASLAQNTYDADAMLSALQVMQVPRHPRLGAAFAPVVEAERPKVRQKGVKMASSLRRLVQVFIADTDENVPLDQCLLYRGEQKLTDLTDQELFFEIDVKTILDAHNVERVKLVNKAVKERRETLEPARVRDLKMTVVTVAEF